MTRRIIDPDVTRGEDGVYWAAALALAIQAGDYGRAKKAQRQLRRLGYPLKLVRPHLNKLKGVPHVR